MNISQPSLGFAPYNNRNLFADHFLQKVLPHQPQWQNASGVDEAFDAVQKLWGATQHFTNKTNEAQTENDLIKPILDLLWSSGCYQVQPRIPNVDVQRQPDYAFFTAPEERTEAQSRIGTMEYWRDVPALGDAKKWSASLDKERSADENPSAQIGTYLYRSKVRWGILTNGRTWRLYEKEKSSPGGVFYEIDLADIMTREDRAAFRYFYLFFRRESLMPDASGVSFLEMVFRGSVQYAAAVGNHLKESVYDALRELMNGFHEYSGNALDLDNSDTLRLVHQNSLIVLYRLLFLLYAEDRDLLPCEQEPYREYSLRKLQKEINGRLRVGNAYLPPMTGVWARLCNLFALIDEGFPQGGIPAYNGGLFNPAKYPHIAHAAQPQVARWQIGDRRLAQVIDLLAYERKSGDTAGSSDIDYRTLDVQHLGSIYEGLLELQPRMASEVLVEVTEDKKTVFKPKSEVAIASIKTKAREIAARELYLVTNRGERKASGSYYTPKYIVDYIVENTISPLSDAAAERVKALRPDVDARIRELENRRRQWDAQSPHDEAAAIESRKLGIAIEEQKRRLLEPYLSIKVLDPAMGSGHFLVGAADFLSGRMAEAEDDGILLPLAQAEGEDPQLSFKRLVVERCLYGVDLNPLSVELAKLSLWLHTVSRDKALSFLDHHLRCGNSLIGARLEDDLMKEPPQFNLKGRRVDKNDGQLVLGLYQTLTNQHLVYLLDTLRQIMETPSGDAQTEHLKDRLYREMDARREQFRAVANCWLAPFFGAPVSNAQYQSAVEALSEGETARQQLQTQPWFQNAQQVAQQKNFFHWELEFPEVFLSPHGLKPSAERGFDAVVGNPPYLFGEDVPAGVRAISSQYNFAVGQYDIYWLFYEAALTKWVKKHGFHGYIIPDPILARDETQMLRASLAKSASLRSVAHVGAVFEDPNLSAAVVIWRNDSQPHNSFTVASRVNGKFAVSIEHTQETLKKFPSQRWLVHLDEITFNLISRVYEVSINLGALVKISRGEELGKAALLDSSQAGSEPILSGEDVTSLGYPEPSKHILSNQVTKSRTLYRAPKIVFVKTGQRIVSTLDTQGVLTLQSIYNIHLNAEGYELYYLSALLKSKLLSLLAMKTFTDYKQMFPQFNQTTVESLPIRAIDFTTPEAQRAQQLEEAKQLYELYLSSGDKGQVLSRVREHLDATPERADVAHDFLAFLAERMIALNTQKQEETRKFLLWLERRLKHSLDAMSNKTRIREYHNADFASLQAALKQNKRKHGVDVETREFEELLESEWRQSVDKLAPLKARLALTDDLIDAVVYQLYGLTDEEIRVVKGESLKGESVNADEASL